MTAIEQGQEPPAPKYKRVLMKISGEALMGDRAYGLDPDMVSQVANEIRSVWDLGGEVCVVIGGGNIFRGVSAAAKGMERATADYMGMLATVMNALAMQSALEGIGVPCRVLSALPISAVAEPYIRRRAVRHMEKRRVVIFAAGTGNPFFTTDSAACLRGIEVDADLVLKATKVDGVYSADPMIDPDAKKYDHLSYDEVLDKKLEVMDLTAICLCRDHEMPLRVFAMEQQGALLNIVVGGNEGTLVSAG